MWLHDAGYTTGLVGKYLNDYTVYGNHHVPPGWSTWVAMDSVPEERYHDYTLNENGTLNEREYQYTFRANWQNGAYTDEDIVNVYGSGISLGHPIAAVVEIADRVVDGKPGVAQCRGGGT